MAKRAHAHADDHEEDVWPKTVYATAGHVTQQLVYNQAELDDALANGWRLNEQSETGA